MDSGDFVTFMLGIQVFRYLGISLLSYLPLLLFCVIRVVEQVTTLHPEMRTRHLRCKLGSIA